MLRIATSTPRPPRLRRWLCSLLLALAPAKDVLSEAGPAPVVSLGGQIVRGLWSDAHSPIAEFRGIPFAQPPVGALRWSAPLSLGNAGPGPASAVDATRFGPACMQGSGGVLWYVGVARAFGAGPESVGRPVSVSEDCLYLNVWSPHLQPGADLPVMVFVHGGGNSGGWSYEPNYLGHNLAARGVVVVTIAYRLGPFGFFSHAALGDGQQEPVANFGLLDIRAAFEWVRENIRQFGGDPGNVTAFGESAGALNLVDLLLADIAGRRVDSSGFRRLIVQSLGGPLVHRQTLLQEQEVGAALASHLGLASGVTAAALRSVAPEKLLAAAAKLPEDYYPDGVIDGRILVEQPLDILATASASGVEMILGTNADEWLMYLDEAVGEEELDRWLRDNAPGREARLREWVSGSTNPRKALDRLRTAREMLCPSRALALAVENAGGRAWMYYFTRQRAGAGGLKLGAYHGAELPYVFDTHDDWLPTQAADSELTSAVLDYWTGFARGGSPQAERRPAWPQFTARAPRLMELGEQPRVGDSFDDGLCAVLGPGQATGSG